MDNPKVRVINSVIGIFVFLLLAVAVIAGQARAGLERAHPPELSGAIAGVSATYACRPTVRVQRFFDGVLQLSNMLNESLGNDRRPTADRVIDDLAD